MARKEIRDYGRFKELLESQEAFPLDYTLKLIGNNTARFAKATLLFEQQFPKLKLLGRRESAKGGHLALTYGLTVESSHEIIWIYEQASTIADLRVLL